MYVCPASKNCTCASKMADVLTGEYLDSENCIQSVVLESELTVVVKEKLCIHPWISIF